MFFFKSKFLYLVCALLKKDHVIKIVFQLLDLWVIYHKYQTMNQLVHIASPKSM